MEREIDSCVASTRPCMLAPFVHTLHLTRQRSCNAALVAITFTAAHHHFLRQDCWGAQCAIRPACGLWRNTDRPAAGPDSARSAGVEYLSRATRGAQCHCQRLVRTR